MTVLERILNAKRLEIQRLAGVALPVPPAGRVVDLRRPTGEPLRLLAEIKRRSPSAGALSTRLSVAERAAAYQRAGADMVSVLCDEQFFDGSYSHLALARQACSLPLLCKDFVLDEVQIRAAKSYGADAILLIVRCLAAERLHVLVEASRRHELEPLVEVTTEEEAEVALRAGATLIGVNARDLDTLEVDVERAARVLESLRARSARVHLSGLATPEQVAAVAASGVDAALIGEALMRQDDPSQLLTQMRVAAM